MCLNFSPHHKYCMKMKLYQTAHVRPDKEHEISFSVLSQGNLDGILHGTELLRITGLNEINESLRRSQALLVFLVCNACQTDVSAGVFDNLSAVRYNGD